MVKVNDLVKRGAENAAAMEKFHWVRTLREWTIAIVSIAVISIALEIVATFLLARYGGKP